MSKVYLAGPITGLAYGGAVDWRVAAKEYLTKRGIDGYSPMRGKDYLKNETHIALYYSEEVSPLSTPRGIMTRDRYDCRTADLVLVNFLGAEKVSIGTVMEIAWADAHRVPIVAAMEPNNIHAHAMINEALGYRVDTLEEALAITVVVLKP
jgi:nucleoside 2-deoxyribosyltransferase